MYMFQIERLIGTLWLEANCWNPSFYSPFFSRRLIDASARCHVSKCISKWLWFSDVVSSADVAQSSIIILPRSCHHWTTTTTWQCNGMIQLAHVSIAIAVGLRGRSKRGSIRARHFYEGPSMQQFGHDRWIHAPRRFGSLWSALKVRRRIQFICLRGDLYRTIPWCVLRSARWGRLNERRSPCWWRSI